VLGTLLSCGVSRHELVRDPEGEPSDAAVGSSTAGDGQAASRAGAGPELEPTDAGTADAGAATRCGKHACACDNGDDDDHDGLVDGLDPECTAAFDDDEATFATGLPNKLGGCRDCFWDDNSGNGDDGCRYPSACLTGEAPSGNGNCASCAVSSQCVSACRVRTPNGCDCFGCCEVVRDNADHVYIELRDDCQLSKLDDLTSCPRCVQHSDCANPCGRCELCLGKTEAQLPADCESSSGGPNYRCEDGRSCRGSSDCLGTEYCQMGCCLVDLR
jgi:hypothetical protein